MAQSNKHKFCRSCRRSTPHKQNLFKPLTCSVCKTQSKKTTINRSRQPEKKATSYAQADRRKLNPFRIAIKRDSHRRTKSSQPFEYLTAYASREKWAAAGLSIAVLGGFAFASSVDIADPISFLSFEASFTTCNGSPFHIVQNVFSNDGRNFKTIAENISLAPGECRNHSARSMRNSPTLWTHSEIAVHDYGLFQFVNSVVNNQLVSDGDTANDRLAYTYGPQDIGKYGAYFACLDRDPDGLKATYPDETGCKSGQEFAAISYGYNGAQPTEWWGFFEAPNLSFFPQGYSLENGISEVLSAMPELRQSVERQRTYVQRWGAKSPFSVGAKLFDLNGPFGLGVWVSDTPTRTIFNRPFPLQPGDAIIRVNGRKVLGEADLMLTLIEHGTSRSKGIQESIKYDVLREGRELKFETSYFFDLSHRSTAPNAGDLAIWYGIGDAIAFHQTPWVVCNGENAIQLAAQGASYVFEWALSELTDRGFDHRNTYDPVYIDAAECEWQHQQRRGLERQVNDEVYTNVQWFAIVTPSAFRFASARILKAANITSKASPLTMRLVDGALEAGETALWSFTSAAPDMTIEERVNEALRVAPYGAAGGFILGGGKVRMAPD